MKRLLLILFLLEAHINAAQLDGLLITFKLADSTTVKVDKAFIKENKTLEHMTTDLDLTDLSQPEQLEKKKTEDHDEPIPLLNEFITQKTIEQLQALTGKSEESVKTIVEKLDQKKLTTTLLAAYYLANQHTKTLTYLLAQKLLAEGINPEVSTLFEKIKVVDQKPTLQTTDNDPVRRNLVDMIRQQRSFFHIHTFQDIDASPDRSLIVTTARDRIAKVWSAPNDNLLKILSYHRGNYSAQFSPDGSQILTISNDDGPVKVWSALTGELIHTLQHTRGVFSAQFSPDGSQIVTTSADKTTKVWERLTPTLVKKYGLNLYEVPLAQIIEWVKTGKIEKAKAEASL